MRQTGVCVCSCAYRRHNPVRNHFPWSMRAMARQGPPGIFASIYMYLRKTLAFAKMQINISRDMLLLQPPWSRAVGSLPTHNATPYAERYYYCTTKLENHSEPRPQISDTTNSLNDPSAIGIPRSSAGISNPRLSITRVGRLPQESTR
jgi:hypothetical protein